MIKFHQISKDQPYRLFKKKYDEALKANQLQIQAAAVSSFSKCKMEVDSRYVNIKFLNKDHFIFFTNYDSPKSMQFDEHNQISLLFFWPSIITQIRIMGKISKTSDEYSDEYFSKRDKYKNALAISSNQSKAIDHFSAIEKNFYKTYENVDLSIRPSYWGGFSIHPYRFEFWEGGKHRINNRRLFIKNNEQWQSHVLQP